MKPLGRLPVEDGFCQPLGAGDLLLEIFDAGHVHLLVEIIAGELLHSGGGDSSPRAGLNV
ncbi:hypothetical protein [Bradyrhizobium liaoningense]